MDLKSLEGLGLNRNEAKVYLALLETGPSLAGGISRESGINRRSVYDAARQLSEKGLVSHVLVNGKMQFQPSNPARLLEMAREMGAGVEAMLPAMQAAFSKTRERLEVEVFTGKEGLKSILGDVLEARPREFLTITSGMTTVLLPYYIDKWHERRVRAGIRMRMLMNDTELGRKRGICFSGGALSEVRYLPKGFETPSHIYIYGDKVAVTIWAMAHPFGILIDNSGVSKRFAEFFEWFWKNAGVSARSPSQ